MRFEAMQVDGAWLIHLQRAGDARGWFARTWCREAFAAHGIDDAFVQCNVSFTARRGTLRGMHWQAPPHAEAKLVRCDRGAVYDCIIDLRPSSPTYLRWQAVELSADNPRQLYVPEGFAHGFQTLTDEALMHYQMSRAYEPGAKRGLRHDDPAFAIDWPIADPRLSDADRAWPDFQPRVAMRE